MPTHAAASGKNAKTIWNCKCWEIMWYASDSGLQSSNAMQYYLAKRERAVNIFFTELHVAEQTGSN